jgi:hypothetical protein
MLLTHTTMPLFLPQLFLYYSYGSHLSDSALPTQNPATSKPEACTETSGRNCSHNETAGHTSDYEFR